MKRLSLEGEIQAIVKSSGGMINRKHLTAVSVTSLQVDTRQFKSKDLTGKREGFINLSIAGQSSLFPYSGKGQVDISGADQIAFLGRFPGPLPVSIHVVESDKKARDALLKGSEFAAAAAKVFGAAGVDLAEYGSRSVGAFLAVLAKWADDDDEAVGFTVIEDPLAHAATVEITLGGTPAHPLARVVLTVEDFGIRDTRRMVGVRIGTPWFEWTEKKISERRKRVTGKGYQRKSYDVQNWLRIKKRMKQWVFSAASGRHRSGLVLPFKSVPAAIHWDKHELFRISSVKTMDRRVVPLALNFSLQPDHTVLEPVVDVIRAGAQLAGELDPDLKTAARTIEKAGRSYGDLVTQFSPEAMVLFQFDGAVSLLPEGVPAEEGVKNGKIELAETTPGIWRGTISRGVRGWGKDLGRFGFDLEIAGG